MFTFLIVEITSTHNGLSLGIIPVPACKPKCLKGKSSGTIPALPETPGADCPLTCLESQLKSRSEKTFNL